MKIVSADFIRAAEKKQDYPPGGATEIAFAGRSNVGKSSMINALLGRRNLVRTSKTPGHTRKLNFYLINDRFIFVDLPGYGYAKVPLSVKGKWGPMVETYLAEREELAGLVVIVDARRPPTESDMNLIEYLQSRELQFIMAATKADKLSRSQMAGYRRVVKEHVGENVPVVLFSSYSGEGKKELWREINALME
jgi:GTP-binding protein